MAEWTRKAPKKVGFYWTKFVGSRPYVIEVKSWETIDTWMTARRWWSEPIPPTLARKARRKAKKK